MTGTVHDPKWSLERRESSGHLVWRKESPSSKVRFRFDVEVLEFEKQPHEYIEHHNDGFSISSISSTVVLCATCVAAVAVSVFLPWYLMEKSGGGLMNGDSVWAYSAKQRDSLQEYASSSVDNYGLQASSAAYKYIKHGITY